ncbi:glycosyltransferase family 2 protein [Henriciella sp. AS95]|uniref:glycosyltransferase family 2 protein n=1 Tax=Henriciella sp. AS95 TaxID=3135782 RepID=UPI00317C709F
MADTATLAPITSEKPPIVRTDAGEAMLSNGVTGETPLTICVPCYHDSADPLAARLSRLDGAHRTTLIFFDDGSADDAMSQALVRHVMAHPGPAHLVTSPRNIGRSEARNRLTALAKTDWLLFLDADMCPDTDRFLTRYLKALDSAEGPSLIAGGFSVRQVGPTSETGLHHAQSKRSECLPAAIRSEDPGLYVFSSNILVHADILNAIGFDEGFTGWGWEDVDWGLRVAEAYPVIHIDNTATHLGLDPTAVLIEKFGGSGANFARLAERHPDAMKSMKLFKMARLMRFLPARPMWRGLTKFTARQSVLPMSMRLAALKTYRALEYAEHLS